MSKKLTITNIPDFINPIIPYTTLEQSFLKPGLAVNNGLFYTQVGHLGAEAPFNPFPIGQGDSPAYPLAPAGIYLIDHYQLQLSYPRKPSAFLDELQLYAAQPIGPYSATIAPKRLADNAGWRSLLLRNNIDLTNRCVSTGIFQQWIKALWRSFTPPLVGQDLVITNLSFYTKATSLESYAAALNVTQQEHMVIKIRRPYFFNRTKLVEMINRWNPVTPHDFFQMYLVLAAGTLGDFTTNVIFVDVSDTTGDFEQDTITSTDVTIFDHAKLLTVMSTQHPLEELILTHVLYPHSQPELDTVDAAGDLEPYFTPRKGIATLEYNGLDHLCHLMDTLQDPLTDIDTGNFETALARNALFFYTRHFMKAFTVSSLGLPFPHVKNGTTAPELAPLATTFCSPFLYGNRTAIRNKRFYFFPWEFLIAMGGSMADKVKLIHAANAPSSDPSDAETETYCDAAGNIYYYPKMPTNRFVLSASEAPNPQYGQRTFTAKSRATITHHTRAEQYRPFHIMDKRQDFETYSAYSPFTIRLQLPTLRNYRVKFSPEKVNGGQFDFLDLKNLLDQ